MATVLERLLAEIEAVPDEMDRVCDQALNSFPAPPTIIGEWDAYCCFLARFYRHLEEAFLAIPPPARDQSWCCGLCWQLLSRQFGQSAPQAGFEIVRTGTEGGVLGLLRTVAGLLSQEKAEQRIGLLVHDYWVGRSFDQKWADAEEYIDRYGHVLPSELIEELGGRIHANFHKVLQQHPLLMRRLRRATG